MQTSIFLAQLIGPGFLVIGLGMLLNRDGYRAMAQEFLKSRALRRLTSFRKLNELGLTSPRTNLIRMGMCCGRGR